jgi:nucleoside 2-deoxyribosyltransferase
MNVEIFKEIDESSLVVADLTRMRPNCVMELAYALGQGKKVIITAANGTTLPFDINAIPCFFWRSSDDWKEIARYFEEFMRLNISRGPLVRQQLFQEPGS